MTESINNLTNIIIAFYTTVCERTRKNLQTELEKFQQGHESWKIAIQLIDATKPINVQFYGAEVLYQTLLKNFDEAISVNIENVELLKSFLLQKLSIAHSLSHSVLNKLSSSLALFMLKCMPDIWESPLKDLILLWFDQLELLLRIIAEIPVEYKHINASLDQRNHVRIELLKQAKDILQIAQHVLEDADSSPSLRNAAIECVEAWLKFPGMDLTDFMPTFNAVFANIDTDLMTLAGILGTLKSNDEIRNHPTFVWQIIQYIALYICPRVQSELNTILKNEWNEAGERMDDLLPLVCAIVEFSFDSTKLIVNCTCKNISNSGVVDVYLKLCNLFLYISTLPGHFPNNECLSDLPESWWYSLREELLQPDEGATWSSSKKQLRQESVQWYLTMLESAIDKFTCSPERINQLDKQTLERHRSYRLARSDVSLNTIQIAPHQTITLLSNNLNASLDAYNPHRCEAIFYLLTEAADFLTETQLNLLFNALLKCGTLDEWIIQVPIAQLIQFIRTFLYFVQSTEHLLLKCQQSNQIVPYIIRIILSYLKLPEACQLSFETLMGLMKSRENVVKSNIDLIIQNCYQYFIDLQHLDSNRLLAMRCVGMGLSYKDAATIIESLNQILAPRLTELDALASQMATSARINCNPRMKQINFELSILAQLVATLDVNKYQQQQQSGLQEQQLPDSPVRSVLNQSLPLFNRLLNSNRNFQSNTELIAKICDVLNGGLQSLYTGVSPFLADYLNFLDAIVESNSEPACELAKKLYLTFHKATAEETPILLHHLAKWYTARSTTLQHNPNASFPMEFDEKLIALGYQIARKFCDSLKFGTLFSATTATDVTTFVRSMCFLISLIIEQSQDISLIQEALRLMNFLMKNFYDNEVLNRCIESTAERLIRVVFMSIHRETTTLACVNLIADVLFQFANKYPRETRDIIQQLPGGNSQLVGAMFNQHSTRNFRMRVLQMHQLAHQSVT